MLELSSASWLTWHAKRDSMRRIMIRVSHDLAGETRFRLSYAFKRLGYVDDEILSLQDHRWWVRADACKYLSLMQSREAIADLVKLLDEEAEDVRIEAAQALIEIAHVDALLPLIHHLKEISLWMEVRLSTVILAMGSSAVRDLISGIKTDSPRVQMFCIRMLGEIGDISAVPTILEYIDYENPDVQKKSLIALGKLGDNRSVPIILKYLHHPIEELRVAAAQALGFLLSPQTIQALHALLMNDTIDVRLAAGESLKKADERGRRALMYAARSSDPLAKNIALQFLEK